LGTEVVWQRKMEIREKINLEKTSPVVLKREPFGSLWEEFFIPGTKFVPKRNWGGQAVDEKN